MAYPYPPPPPYPPQPPQRPASSGGVHWIVWLLGGGALLFAFALGGVFVLYKLLMPAHPSVTYVTYGGGGYSPTPYGVRSGGGGGGEVGGSTGSSGGSGGGSVTADDENLQIDPGPKLPPVKREVPVHPITLLDGCSKTDLDGVETRIDGAIHVGAPLYNDGDFAGCYHTYESASQSIEKSLPASCKGPAKALKAGRERALHKSTPAEQAWAMRDAFDGLLDVIDRQGPNL